MRLSHPRTLLGAAILGAAAAAGCGTVAATDLPAAAPVESTAPRAADNGLLSAEENLRAARLNRLKCARCHKLYDRAGYSDAEWRTWMTTMSRKARLTADQQALLSRYLAGTAPVSAP